MIIVTETKKTPDKTGTKDRLSAYLVSMKILKERRKGAERT